MTTGGLVLPVESCVPELAGRVAAAGGRILVVGGWVRDALRGHESHDLDLEVFGLAEDEIDPLLAGLSFSTRVGRQFPVWRRVRDGVDLAYPRSGAEAYRRDLPESLAAAFRAAARHRDLRVNAIGWDPLTECLIDPWQGVEDLRTGQLRAVDPETFPVDPLRLLRVARLAAVLDAAPDDELRTLCRGLDFAAVAVERVAGELSRMLLDPERPSRSFSLLAELGRLDVFPPIERLVAVPQDPQWHPEGDVFVHTGMVVDRAREIIREVDAGSALILMLAALCHDLGKPETTTFEGTRVRSLAHEEASAQRARDWLSQLRFPERVVRTVGVLVAHHLAPSQLVGQASGPRAFRRLARRLAVDGGSLMLLEKLARADHLGRTTAEALSGRYDAGADFLAAANQAEVRDAPRPDVVSAQALMRCGIAPGPELGRLLRRCREIEDETGWHDPERIIERCMSPR